MVEGDDVVPHWSAEIIDEAQGDGGDSIGLIFGETEEEAQRTAELIAEVLNRVTDGITRPKEKHP
ncbi:MAG: hypothetical protein L3K00_03070 [Thermoplasmata archaeon]|nr:hypothetical protein [Thermoplasmata archaeon]